MISIQNPCPIKWENMTPVLGGNYCDSCCKVVVDFSQCSNEEILNYFSANTEKRICGRFLKGQVSIPQPKKRLSRFFAAAIFVFGAFLFSSCHNEPKHEEPKSKYVLGGVEPIHLDSMELIKMDMEADSARNADSINKIAEKADSLHKADSLKKHKANSPK